ncbi:MAG: sigma-54-dependent Fis family transcriptional regulator [Bacteroidales bacterium]|jgi:DNA-binding NtrC family response regulator|nr:sigma-54-dependent Fis family transcriptional regulator [Bacteroidales bacterium]NLD64445.1 sigma-54-dependent Fis family transcriptional regulator [Bacteroidales bacterium]HNT93519.1 sigma-54 dependent transcriptional regulator [Bacteroidales bacterium]HOO66240.1 sigma-54 dependent transcriptional regulator [Bacteroidales bacterium]HPE22233.1 sigma-54 dependent transcriptional regulator [Bacteroidales bacterium]
MADTQLKIFVVEDDEWYNRLLVHTLSLNVDYEVKSFASADEFLKCLHEAPDIVTLDYRLPDMNGLDLLKRIKEENSEVQVILISGQDDIETAVSLLKVGVYDYIVKTDDIRERLLLTVQNIRNGIGMKREISSLRREVQKKYMFRNTIMGESTAIKAVCSLIEKALDTNITVIITGETGTGKELVAKAIHYNSKRRHKPFVPVNVTAIPSELIESELFGHEKGAFTGALSKRIGRFEEADGGTLFLDEIGEMDPALQSKLLRALQEKEIVRVGSNKPIRTDCRIIVATNRNLLEEVKKGNFREDLYYRLRGMPVELPPLRERSNDILILANHFIERFCTENDIPLKKLSEQSRQKLLGYPFPGNIRELKSVVELAVTLAETKTIGPRDIILDPGNPLADIMDEELTLRQYEIRIIKAMLRKNDNDIRTVAAKLDIGISTIYRLLREEKQS